MKGRKVCRLFPFSVLLHIFPEALSRNLNPSLKIKKKIQGEMKLNLAFEVLGHSIRKLADLTRTQ